MTTTTTTKRRRKAVDPLPYPQFQPGQVLTDAEREVVVTFGMALCELRTDRGLTRSELAVRLTELLGGKPVFTEHVAAWEEGRALPPIPIAMRFDAAMNLDRGTFRVRAALVDRRRAKLLRDAMRAEVKTLEALAEDGRPPRARRRRAGAKKTA